mgnify:CR=1 FL=1
MLIVVISQSVVSRVFSALSEIKSFRVLFIGCRVYCGTLSLLQPCQVMEYVFLFV